MEDQENEGMLETVKSELLLITNNFWQALADRNIEKRFLHCADTITFIGTGLDEKASGKAAYFAINKKGVEQYPEKFKLNILWERASVMEDMGWVESETEWAQIINGKEEKTLIRNTIVLKKIEGKWWILHVHGSVPDFRLSGQNYITNAETIKINRELESEVYQRTKELKQKNKELEIETSLEKVRTVAMSMRKPDDMLDVCRIISEQLELLGVKEIRNVQTAIFYEDKGVYINFEYYCLHHKSLITEVAYKSHPLQERFANAMINGDGEMVSEHFTGKEVKDWVEYQATTPQFVDTHLYKASSLNYYWYSLGSIALGMSTYERMSDESILLYKRFRNVFDLAYRRYQDIEHAEAQAKEAQIEAALERIRSRTMGMQKSEELKEVIQVVYAQFVHINIDIEHTGFILDYKARDDMHIWLADQHEVPSEVYIPYFDTAHWNSFVEAKEKGLHFFANHLPFDEKNKFYQTLFEKIPGVPQETKEYYFNCPGLAISTVLLENIGLYIENFSGIPYTDEENKTLMRFGKVFQQTYTRFLDLQKAEAQSREARIEASLERVRAKAMAMHSSEDLATTIDVFFSELYTLHIHPHRCGFGINDAATRTVEMYATTATHDHEVKKVHGILKLSGHPVLDGIFEHWLTQEEYHPVLRGQEIHDYYKVMNPQVAVPAFAHDESQYGYYFFFKEGGAFAWFNKEADESVLQIFRRFTSVMSLTHRRYMDLKEAEAQTREAQIETGLERVRSRTMAMQSCDELAETASVVLNELIKLGISPNRLYIAIIENNNTDVHFYLTNEDGGKDCSVYTAQVEKNTSIRKMYDGWAAHHSSLSLSMEGDELTAYFQYLRDDVGVPFKSTLNPKRRIQTIAYFSQGYIGIASPEDLSEETRKLLERFAAVFNLTYTRFNDLKQAEKLAYQANLDLFRLKEEKARTELALAELKATQAQLIQSEKMASLGELTAGIAHEIQNPLNFVNNFSEVNTELIEEMKQELQTGNTEEAIAIANDIADNEQKINHHGKRADAIVKGMLQHSRSSSGATEPTDINALADEYLRLAYHGLRAKDKSFNATTKTDFDPNIGMINVIPQDIGRVILNLITNAFYAVSSMPSRPPKGGETFVPIVTIKTRKLLPPLGGKGGQRVEVSVSDNGPGIPQNILDKIFQPFFTTKPTGQGTGLGLSLSYDIVKAHGGELTVETTEGEGTTFIIQLPIGNP